jgi:hypothetical protein
MVRNLAGRNAETAGRLEGNAALRYLVRKCGTVASAKDALRMQA